MYLLTTGGEVDAVEVQPQLVRASTSAAIVLPVPLAPANSALMPKPAAARARRTPTPRRRVARCRTCTAISRSIGAVRDRGSTRSSQPRRGFDPLGKVLQCSAAPVRGSRPTRSASKLSAAGAGLGRPHLPWRGSRPNSN